MNVPHPRDIAPLVCPRISECTAKAVSIHTNSSSNESALRVYTRSFVPLRYSNSRFNLLLSCFVNFETQVHKNEMVNKMSGLAQNATNSNSAMILWKFSAVLSSNRSELSSISNKSIRAGVGDCSKASLIINLNELLVDCVYGSLPEHFDCFSRNHVFCCYISIF